MADANGTNGTNGHKPASFLQNTVALRDGQRVDPASKIDGMPPNFGRFPLRHAGSFQMFMTSIASVYRDYDEAVKHSLDNARYMRNDCGIMECLEARQRATALLNWHIEPEDDKSQDQKALCEELTKILERIRRFAEYRMNLQHALWYGKYGIQHRYGWQTIGGHRRVLPTPERENPGWLPINGDKIVFRFDTKNLQAHQFPHQVGIRVGVGLYQPDDIRSRNEPYVNPIEATDRGMAYFLTDAERKLLTIHKHSIEDGAFEDALSAGMIHGVGIRSRIYWDWFQKQEALGFLIEYLERSAGGIELWQYPQGNPSAKSEMETAAREHIGGKRNVLLVPVPPGEEGLQYGVQVIEPGLQGIDVIKDLLDRYYGHRIKRYILGQTLSSEAEATGLGSGVADLHMETFQQIIHYDAGNLEETITADLLDPIKRWNFPRAAGINVRFKIDTEKTDQDQRLKAFESAWSMGARIKEQDVLDTLGAAVPTPDERVLENPQIQQAKAQTDAMRMQQQQMMGGGRAQASVLANIAPDPQRDAAQLQQLLGAGGDGQQQPADGGDGGEWAVAGGDGAEAMQQYSRDWAYVDKYATFGSEGGNVQMNWDEHEHPRGGGGQFSNKGGGDSSAGGHAGGSGSGGGSMPSAPKPPSMPGGAKPIPSVPTNDGKGRRPAGTPRISEAELRGEKLGAPAPAALSSVPPVVVPRPIPSVPTNDGKGRRPGGTPRISEAELKGEKLAAPKAPSTWMSLSHHDAPQRAKPTGGAKADFDFAGAFKNANPGAALVDQLWEGVQKGQGPKMMGGMLEQAVEKGRQAGLIKHRQHIDFLKDNATDAKSAAGALTALSVLHRAHQKGVPLMVDEAGNIRHPEGADVGDLIPHIKAHKALFVDLAKRLAKADYRRDGERANYAYMVRDPDLRTAIEKAADETERDPSDAAKAAGNYRKGKFAYHGLEIAIETPKGATRKGKSRLGVPWETTMPAHYGYIRRTESEADGMHVDCFVGDTPESEIVFVVDQQTDGGRFDEHKCMLGFRTTSEARQAYIDAYTPGWKGLRDITPIAMPQFKAWLADGATSKPFAAQVSKYARTWADKGNIHFDWSEDGPGDGAEAGGVGEKSGEADKPKADNCGTGAGGFKPGNTCAGEKKAGNEAGPAGKVKVSAKKYGDRWYATADLPNGKQVTRSDTDQAKAVQLAHQDIRDGGFEPHNPEDERNASVPPSRDEASPDAGYSKPDSTGRPLFNPAADPESAPAPLQPKLPGASEPQTTLRKGKHAALVGATVMHVGDLNADPTRFQYKIAGIDPKTGVTRELKGVAAWNPILGGILTVWQDPADGKTYVINGHHRSELARRAIGRPLSELLPGMAHDPQFDDGNGNYNGAMQVQYLDAADAKSARAMGALANIAEGRGTAIDAAKFMRDTGTTPEMMERYGISLKGAVSQNGATLRSLSDNLFDRLTTGRMTEGRALAIAQHLPDADRQDELFGRIQKAEEKRDLSDATIAEMAREMSRAGSKQTSGGLFGGFFSESTFAERAELKAHLRRALTSEARAFREASSERRQTTLESTGTNVLDVTGNKQRAQSSAEAVYDFDTRANASGDPVAEAIDKASEEFANASNERERNAVKRQLAERIRGILGDEGDQLAERDGGSESSATRGGDGSLSRRPISGVGQAADREQFGRLRSMIREARDRYGLSPREARKVERMVRRMLSE